MITTNWKRAAVGACTATALVVGAGLAFAPAANAAPAAHPSIGLVGGLTNGVTGVVSGLLGGGTTPTSTPSSTAPVTVASTGGGVSVGLGGTTVTVGLGGTGTGSGSSSGIGVGVGTSTGSGLGVVLGTTSGGSTGTVGVGGTITGTGSGSGTGTPDPTSTSSTPTSTAIVLSALSVSSQYPTVYPAKDGYRDTNAFTLHGTTSDGQQHAATGTATLTFGSSTVATWPITSTGQTIVWNGLKGAKIVPGRYVLTATIGDSAGSWVAGAAAVDVSAKKLATTSALVTSKSVSGTHKMSAKPLAGLSKGKVTLRITSVASHVKGKQYLVITHAGKHLRIRILNGKHTSKAVTIPKSFTTYTITHTWKKGTVKVASLKYRYSYKTLK